MDRIKAQLARLAEQLSGLTPSQKMLAAALVVIMAMTLSWWARYAGEPDMEPVLNQTLSENDVQQILARLDAKGIPHRLQGTDKILVPPDRKFEILADLGYSRLLPKSTETGFDSIIKQMNVFDSDSREGALWNEAKQRTLAQVISDFPGVVSARVVIDDKNDRRLDGSSIVPSAMVNIQTREGHGPLKQLAAAAADVVSGAVAGLARSRVVTVIDGVTIKVGDKDNLDSLSGSDDIVEAQHTHEEMYRQKILEQLGFINGLMVSVTVQLNTKTSDSLITTNDPKGVIQKEIQTDEHKEETPIPAGPSQPEAGVVPNTGMSVVPGTSAGGGTATIETNKTQYLVDVPKTEQKVHQGPGDAVPVAAAVRVPRSYFIASYRNANSGKDPDENTLKQYAGDELNVIRKEVKACTMIKDDSQVTVNWYSDAMPALGSTPSAAPSSSPMSLLFSGHVKEIGIGALALISLFMVSMIVRKGAPVPVLAATVTEETETNPTRLKTAMELAGEVGESDQAMEGMELGDEEVKSQQMVEQVSSMVGDNPDTAATLIKRWMNRA
jgi:flagellar biosynthesis/type III secretory pathway M-ring protein FliF/YscJ